MKAKGLLKYYNSSISSKPKRINTNSKFFKIKYVYIKNNDDKKKYTETSRKHKKNLNSTDIKSNSNTDAETIIKKNSKINKILINNLTNSEQIISNKNNFGKILPGEEFNNNLKNKQLTPKTPCKTKGQSLEEFFKNRSNNKHEDNKFISIPYNEEDLIKKLSSIKIDKYYISNKTKADLTELCGSDKRGNISHNLRIFQMKTLGESLNLNAAHSKIKTYKTLSNSVKSNILNRNTQILPKNIVNEFNNIKNYPNNKENNNKIKDEKKKTKSKINMVPFYKITNIYSSESKQNISLTDFNKIEIKTIPSQAQKKHNKNNLCEEEEVAQKRPGKGRNLKNKTEVNENNEEEGKIQTIAKTFVNNSNNQSNGTIPYRKLETFPSLNSKILNKVCDNIPKINIKNQNNKIKNRKNSCNEYMENSQKCKINKFLSVLKKMERSRKLSRRSKNSLSKTSKKTLNQENKQNTININIHNCSNDNYNCFLINIDKDEKNENFLKSFKNSEIKRISQKSSKTKSCRDEKVKLNQNLEKKQKKIKPHVVLEPKLLKSPYNQIQKIFKNKIKLNPIKTGLLNNRVKTFGYCDKINDDLFNTDQTDESDVTNKTNTNYYSINQNKRSDFVQKKIKDILMQKAIKTEYGKKMKQKKSGNMFFIDLGLNKKENGLSHTENY